MIKIIFTSILPKKRSLFKYKGHSFCYILLTLVLLYSYDERILDEESGRAAEREERLIDFQATSKVGVVDSDPVVSGCLVGSGATEWSDQDPKTGPKLSITWELFFRNRVIRSGFGFFLTTSQYIFCR